MKKLFSIVLVVVLTLTMFVGCGPSTDNKTIAVIAMGESHAFWQAVKSGCVDAGEKFGYQITFRGPPNESPESIPIQMEQVTVALNNKPSALALASIGTGFDKLLIQAFDSKIPVIQFDAGIYAEDIASVKEANKNPIQSLVATSNVKASAIGADNFFPIIKEEIANSTSADPYLIGIIQHETAATGVDREKGFRERMTELCDGDTATKGKYKIITEIKPGDANNAYKDALEALNAKGCKAIFMCNEGVVNQVYDAIQAGSGQYDHIKFVGFDAGTNQINWIKETDDKAKLFGSVAQDSYMIGYYTVEQAVNAVEGKRVTELVEIAGAWYDDTNIDEMISKNLVYEG